MPIDIENLWVFRMVPIQSLEKDLRQGLFAKNNAPADPSRTVIGNTEIISGEISPGQVLSGYGGE